MALLSRLTDWCNLNRFQNTLSSVDELIKKHDGFTTTLEAQAEKITTLEQLAQALLAQEHYASDQIKSRCKGVVGRMQKVKQAADQRRAKLIDSRNYQQFLGNVYEVLLDGFYLNVSSFIVRGVML